MNHSRIVRMCVAAVLVVIIAAATVVLTRINREVGRVHVIAFFDNSNGVFVGDDVRIRGVKVGKIERIEPQPTRVKISFWFDERYAVPADAKAVILSPTLVTARAIQLTPPYVGGPVMSDGAAIPETRTAVPVEWDDFRTQLEKLTKTLQPAKPGGVSTLGAFVNTAAENLRGQGPAIRAAIIELSQSMSALGDHSGDIFSSIKNLSMLVSALQDSTSLIRQLNANLASVTGLLANEPDEISTAVKDLSDVVKQVPAFVAENREALGVTSDRAASVTKALTDSLDDVKQLLHIAPTTLANAVNIYQPAQGTLTGALAVNNFSDPITFICGAIQAASRLNAEQSSKLCVQYLAPIVKNRQYNFPPIGFNPFVGASVRPNEVTYSEDWLRPDYVPPQPATPPAPSALENNSIPPSAPSPLPAEVPLKTDPAAGLPGLMVPPGG